MKSPIVHVLIVTSTSATLFFTLPQDTLYANQYRVTFCAMDCHREVDDRIIIFKGNIVTMADLLSNCTYFVDVISRNTYAELSSDFSTTVNLTTLLLGILLCSCIISFNYA